MVIDSWDGVSTTSSLKEELNGQKIKATSEEALGCKHLEKLYQTTNPASKQTNSREDEVSTNSVLWRVGYIIADQHVDLNGN